MSKQKAAARKPRKRSTVELDPLDYIRVYTSKDRRSYVEGSITETCVEDVRVWVQYRVVRGGDREVADPLTKVWLPRDRVEALQRFEYQREDGKE